MRILLTNDDGIHAPGLTALEEIARQLSDDVWVVAPEFDQSGVSHSLSLHDPLRLREVAPRRFAVKGTPTDCVIMGVRHILKDQPPDLILSGVNRGQNAAEDVIYSGTVAGAMEGVLLGIPSIALSQAYGKIDRGRPSYACARARGAEVIGKIIKEPLPPGTLANINFPACPPEEVTGIEVTRQGRRTEQFVSIDQRVDGRGNDYFWIVFGHPPGGPEQMTDLAAMAARRISVTPLKLDLTDDLYRERLASAFEGAVA